jgi:hypothetical protein
MSTMRLGASDNSAGIINDLHTMLMSLKATHYNTTGYAEHQALGMAYDSLDDLADTISEKFMGYSDTRISTITIGTVKASSAAALAEQLKALGGRLIAYAQSKKYQDLENLGQELSGLGAQLKYLSTLK